MLYDPNRHHPSIHLPEGIRLHPTWGVFHHHLHLRPRRFVRRNRGGRNAVERLRPRRRTMLVGHSIPFSPRGIRCIRHHAQSRSRYFVDCRNAAGDGRSEKFFASTPHTAHIAPNAPNAHRTPSRHIQNHRIRCSGVQNRRHQMGAAKHRHTHRLATELLRTHHPPRTRLERHPPLHHRKPPSLAPGS